MAATAGSIGDLSAETDNKKKGVAQGKRGSNANLHNSNTNLAHENENKKKANAANNLIEKKRASLDTRHKYFIEKFASFLDEKPAVIENSLLLGNKLELVNEFLADGGPRKVLFFWQKVVFLMIGRNHFQECKYAGQDQYPCGDPWK